VVLHDSDVEVTPGVRVDVFRSAGASAVGIDPRIASRLRVANGVHVLHTFGVAHQPPSFLIPLAGASIAGIQGGLQTSLQSSAGVEVEFPADTTASLTVFDNVLLNMSDNLANLRPGDEDPFRMQRSLGSAYGAELFVKRKLTHRIGGFLSYTLSRSTRSVGRERFPSGFDRTHVANAAVGYDLGRRWRAGARLVVYSGIPAVPNAQGTIAPLRSEHPNREPAFYRIDLRLEKRWLLGKSAWIAFVAEFLNATLHNETVHGEEIGPISIPSLGVEGGF
jgi:hypothetical protein